MLLARRTLIASAAGALAFAPWIGRARAQVAPVASDQTADALFRELDERIEAAMVRYHVPGVAVGVFWQGREHLKGFGVTNVDHPLPVDAETLFRIGSTTKTFTATAMMRLVEQGKVDLAAPARRYLPDLKLADEAAAASVTVRQLLNHSAGWMGDDYGDFGRGEDAIARYLASVKQLPQLTPPGDVFAYNNAAVVVAGRVIEIVTGKPYETVGRSEQHVRSAVNFDRSNQPCLAVHVRSVCFPRRGPRLAFGQGRRAKGPADLRRARTRPRSLARRPLADRGPARLKTCPCAHHALVNDCRGRRLSDGARNCVMSVECRRDDPHALDRAVWTLLLHDLALTEAVVRASCLVDANT